MTHRVVEPPTTGRRRRTRWRPPVYRMRQEFRAPLGYVFRWWTDYTRRDGQIGGDGYARRLLHRSRRRVVYEDLYDSPTGWRWSRTEVTLAPPDRWTADSVGSHREIRLQYRLRALASGRTELSLRARRAPRYPDLRNPSRTAWERPVRREWARFAKALERDFRAKRPAVGSRRDP